jgi:hypothetical protein
METQTENFLEPLETPVVLPDTPTEHEVAVALEAEMRACWKRGEGWQVEFGLLLYKYRKAVAHGQWIKFLKSEFGLHRQTAWRWITAATEHYNLPPLSDEVNEPDEPNPLPEKIAKAIKEHKEKIAKAPRKPNIRLNGSYKLPLWLTAEQADNLDALRKGPNWTGAQMAIIATIDHMVVQYGIVNPDPIQPTAKLPVLPAPKPYVASDDDLSGYIRGEDATEEDESDEAA